jgi:hypothetical protein
MHWCTFQKVGNSLHPQPPLVRASMLAPCSKSSSMTATWPLLAARCRGVVPGALGPEDGSFRWLNCRHWHSETTSRLSNTQTWMCHSQEKKYTTWNRYASNKAAWPSTVFNQLKIVLEQKQFMLNTKDNVRIMQRDCAPQALPNI